MLSHGLTAGKSVSVSRLTFRRSRPVTGVTRAFKVFVHLLPAYSTVPVGIHQFEAFDHRAACLSPGDGAVPVGIHPFQQLLRVGFAALSKSTPSTGPLSPAKTSALAGRTYRAGIPVTPEFNLVAMTHCPAPTLFVITSEIGNFQFEGLLDSSGAGIDLNQKLARINVRGGLDFGSGPLAGAQLDPLGSLEFKMKGLCQVVPVHCMDRIEVETDMQRSLSLVHQPPVRLGTELYVKGFFRMVLITLCHHGTDNHRSRALGFFRPGDDTSGNLVFRRGLGLAIKIRGRGYGPCPPDELFQVISQDLRFTPAAGDENPAFRRNNEF